MSGSKPDEKTQDEREEVRVLRPTELELLKGGALPGPTAQPQPPVIESGRRDD
jgi:hypothetical protein